MEIDLCLKLTLLFAPRGLLDKHYTTSRVQFASIAPISTRAVVNSCVRLSFIKILLSQLARVTFVAFLHSFCSIACIHILSGQKLDVSFQGTHLRFKILFMLLIMLSFSIQ